MKTELDEYLCKTFPKIFVNRYADMTTTAMCWGFECGDGWFNIINQLCHNIQSHIDWNHKQYNETLKYNAMITAAQNGDMTALNDYWAKWQNSEERIQEALEKGLREVTPPVAQVVAVQIKEKFGTLRFYYDGGDSEIYGMVRMAEAMSGVMCEECGNPGESTDSGWIKTMCKPCLKLREKRRKKELAEYNASMEDVYKKS